MFTRSWFSRAALVAACICLPIASTGFAGPVIGFGGGISSGGLLEVRTDPWTPMGWVSLGGDLGDSWSGFARVGYERHDEPMALVTCLSLDCPQYPRAEQRASYVPMSLGLRLSAPRPALSRLRAYVEAASSLAWARYEQDVETLYPDGRQQRDLRRSDHWLAGIELGAGFSQRLVRGLGLECGLRYAYRAAPRPTDANTALHTDRDAFAQVSLVAALTLGP